MFAAHNMMLGTAVSAGKYLSANITVGTGPMKLAISPDGTKVYAAIFGGSNSVAVINTSTNTVSTTITGLGTSPYGIAAHPNGNKIYITNQGENSVSAISLATNTRTQINYTYSFTPYSVRVSPDGNRVYYCTYDTDGVGVIDGSTDVGITIANLATGSYPYDLAVSPDNSKVYTANREGNTVSVINTSTNTVSTYIDVGPSPSAIVVSPDNSKVYCANAGNNTISVINTSTNAVTATYNCGITPYDMVISPDGSKLYVANANGNSVDIINAATGSVIRSIGVGSTPQGVVVTPDGSKIFVANSGTNKVSAVSDTAAPTPVSLVGSASAAATSVTLPAHSVGDVILIFAYRDGSTTAPSKPTHGGTIPDWTDINVANQASDSNSYRISYTVATATNSTSGTWSNATGIIAVVLSGCNSTTPIGGVKAIGGTAANSATAPAVAMSDTTGTSALLQFYGHRSVTAWSAAPTGYTRLTSVATEVALNKKDITTSDGSSTQANTATSSGYIGAVVEVRV